MQIIEFEGKREFFEVADAKAIAAQCRAEGYKAVSYVCKETGQDIMEFKKDDKSKGVSDEELSDALGPVPSSSEDYR